MSNFRVNLVCKTWPRLEERICTLKKFDPERTILSRWSLAWRLCIPRRNSFGINMTKNGLFLRKITWSIKHLSRLARSTFWFICFVRNYRDGKEESGTTKPSKSRTSSIKRALIQVSLQALPQGRKSSQMSKCLLTHINKNRFQWLCFSQPTRMHAFVSKVVIWVCCWSTIRTAN